MQNSFAIFVLREIDFFNLRLDLFENFFPIIVLTQSNQSFINHLD